MARSRDPIRTNPVDIVVDPTTMQKPGMGTVTLSGGSGTLDTITVDSVSILPSAITYTTDLATTAELAATAINNNYTNPNYWARAAGAVIQIFQVIPAAGTLALASTSTTLGRSDADLTGGAVGDGTILGYTESGVDIQFNDVYFDELADQSGADVVESFYGGGSVMAMAVFKQSDANVLANRFPGRFEATGGTIEFPGTIAAGDKMSELAVVVELRPRDSRHKTMLFRKALLTPDGVQETRFSSAESKKYMLKFTAIEDETIGSGDARYSSRSAAYGLAADLQAIQAAS